METLKAVGEAYPSQKVTRVLFGLLIITIPIILGLLLSVDDPVRLKLLVEDSGPIQTIGQYCIGLAFGLCLVTVLLDRKRRISFLPLSYLLMFYFLREADYHYKVSEYAKATQFKRFFLHDLIPLSKKIFLATIVILFLVVLVRYLHREKHTFILALKANLPWALFSLAWFGVFGLSQAIDQTSIFHTVTGEVFEEVFETSAEIIALLSVILFRLQVWHNARLINNQ